MLKSCCMTIVNQGKCGIGKQTHRSMVWDREPRKSPTNMSNRFLIKVQKHLSKKEEGYSLLNKWCWRYWTSYIVSKPNINCPPYTKIETGSWT